MNRRINGAFAPVPTPISREGQVDPPALARHLSWLGSHGLDGALILGTNGEFPSFTHDERRHTIEHWQE